MKKTLLETNPYLKDSSCIQSALARNIESSSAVEGIRIKRDAITGQFIKAGPSAKPGRVIKKKAL